MALKLPKFENLLVDQRGSQLHVTLNRPEARNALSREMVAELLTVAEFLEKDHEIGTVVLRGAGGVFCAGGDIKGFKASFEAPKPKRGKPDPIAANNRRFGKFLAGFNSLPQTVVAVVEGAAIAGGLGLMSVADVVVAAADTKFALTETSLGIPPAQIAPFVAARIGVSKARVLSLTGARFDGQEAARLGLVDFVCDDAAALEATLKKILADIGRCAPGANAATKRLLLASLTMARDKLLDRAAKDFAACLRSEEGREGVSAYLEKRPTNWAEKSREGLDMIAFAKILIANRGEIALRIARTARDMGYLTVTVYSDADRNMPHALLADEAVPIGPSRATESYLVIEKIIAAAKRTGAGAIHPGYGFLSENADFAEACAAANLVFIGPLAPAIRLMGNKAAAKRRMIEAGVPCVLGYDGKDQSDEAFARAAAKIRFPVMVKAAAGGGGRGIRLVTDAARLTEALRAARAEASKAFGSDELILEKAIAAARHVEIQIFGDRHGNIVHLGERDCSIQRRHQKVIEEAPCPALSPALRRAMSEAAVSACRAIDYVGAGTVEFLLAPGGEFHFLEMNTRLQVEHPVTEMITGLDLVEWQLRVAAGETLPLNQDAIAFQGHAIEARLCAEDSGRDFLPAAGKLLAWKPPSGAGLRVDHALAPGISISPYYDSMLAKIVAHGATREEARRRLVAALKDTIAFGISTNRDFLIDCLSQPVFVAGEANTDFIEKHSAALKPQKPNIHIVALAAVLMAERTQYDDIPMLRHWHSTGISSTFVLVGCGDERLAAEVSMRARRAYEVKCANESYAIEIRAEEGARLRFLSDGIEQTAQYAWDDGVLHLAIDGRTAAFEDVRITGTSATVGGGDAALAPMAGRISTVCVKPGDEVGKGECLIVLEAMKMEHEVTAPREGTIATVLVRAGEQVTTRARLVELAPLN